MKKCLHCCVEKDATQFYSEKSNVCKACKIKQANEWGSKNKDKVKEYRRKSFERNPEAVRASKKKWADANKDKIVNKRLKHLFGITLEDYEELLEAQQFSCAICGVSECSTGKNFAVDHNHETGEIRGLLCKKCNTGLGIFRDSPALIGNAYQYLIDRGHYGSEAA
jgi:Tfp pilus assembly major pilin PilA